MPWSVAALSAFRLSVGESLLSMATISNLTPAGLAAPLNFSARNWSDLTWLVPTGAISPDNGSIQAILTTSPAVGFLACANALPAPTTSAAPAASMNARRTVDRMFMPGKLLDDG